ncbi:MAG: lipopolysaccharide biosynthesis protein [Syntrophales bacterium]
MDDLKLKTVKNIGFNAFSNIAKFLLSAGASIILAQRLSPSDYGVVGFAMIFINFLARFSDLGITDAVIQRNQLDDRGLYTGYTTKCILGIAVFALVFLLSPLAKLFFDNSAIENVIKVLSVSFIISTFGFLPTCLLTRELNYKKLIIPQLSSAVVNSGLSIILALTGFNYWSIVLANVAGTVISVLAVNFLHPVKIKFKFDKKLFREFMGFGGNLFLSGLIIFLIFNADNFAVGTLIGSVALGLYTIAFNWGAMISGRLYDVVHNVLFPTFSRIQNDTNKLKESYLKVLEYITFIGVISNLTLLLCSEDFLYYVLGRGTDKWMPALMTFQILLIYGIIRTFLEPLANVLLALGASKLLLKSNVIAGAVELCLLYPVTKYYGIEGVAILVTVAYSVQYFIYFPFLKKEVDLKYSDIWCFVKPTIISVAFIAALVSFTKGFMDASLSSFIQKLIVSILGYALFYNAITKWKLLKETVSMISSIRMS